MSDLRRQARNRGKDAERRFSKLFGTRRIGVTGLATNDVQHKKLAIEIKYRSKLPAWAVACLHQARTAQTALDKIPVVLMIGRGMKAKDGLAVIQINDLVTLVTEKEPDANR